MSNSHYSLSVSKLAVAVAIGGAPYSLFTVSGFVRVQSIFVYISTAISANSTQIDFRFTPTVGGSPIVLAAGTLITSEPAGTVLGWSHDSADALRNYGEGWTGIAKFPAIFAPGTFIQGISGGTAAGGATDWYIEYVSLTQGARVLAA